MWKLLHLGDRRIDLQTGDTSGFGQLRPVELEVLRYLAHRPGRTVPRGELLRAVWGPALGPDTRALDIAISRIRQVVEARPRRPRHLLTVLRVGYRLEVPPDDPVESPQPDEPEGGWPAWARARLDTWAADPEWAEVERWQSAMGRRLDAADPPPALRLVALEWAARSRNHRLAARCGPDDFEGWDRALALVARERLALRDVAHDPTALARVEDLVGPADPLRAWVAVIRLVRARNAGLELEGAMRDEVLRAVDALPGHGVRPTVLADLGWRAKNAGHPQEASRWFRESVDQAQREGLPARVAAGLLFAAATSSEWAVTAETDALVAHLEALPTPVWSWWDRITLGGVLLHVGRIPRALEELGAARADAIRHGDVFAEAAALHNLALISLIQDRPHEARRRFASASGLFVRVGDRFVLAQHHLIRGAFLLDAALLTQSAALFREFGRLDLADEAQAALRFADARAGRKLDPPARPLRGGAAAWWAALEDVLRGDPEPLRALRRETPGPGPSETIIPRWWARQVGG